MRHLRLLSLGLALALCGTTLGCAQLLGLDETSDLPEAPGGQFSLKRFAIGAQVVIEPLDMTGGSAAFLIPDPLEVTGFRQLPTTAGLTPGTWSADVPDGAEVHLRYTVPGEELIRHLALPSPIINNLHIYYGKPVTEAAPDGASLSLSVTLEKPFAAGERFQWLSLGAWSQRDLNQPGEPPVAGALLLAPPPIAFTSAGTLTGRAHERITSTDAFLVLRHDPLNVLTGAFTADPFDMVSGNNPVSGAMAAVELNLNLSVALDTTEPVTRMAAARPAFAAPNFNWSVTAAPGSAVAAPTGPGLAFGGYAPNTGVVALTRAYGNPFAPRGWPATFTWAATALRSYTPTGGLPVTLTALMNGISVPPIDGQPFAFNACLPTAVAVQGATLISDGLTVTVDRTKPVTVSFVADTTSADRYGMTLYEVVSDPPPATSARLVGRYTSVGTKPSWTVPNDLLQAGKVYTVRASCGLGGVPGLATGDLERRELPSYTGFIESGVFTVAQ
jgi:hypothetical protein